MFPSLKKILQDEIEISTLGVDEPEMNEGTRLTLPSQGEVQPEVTEEPETSQHLQHVNETGKAKKCCLGSSVGKTPEVTWEPAKFLKIICEILKIVCENLKIVCEILKIV